MQWQISGQQRDYFITLAAEIIRPKQAPSLGKQGGDMTFRGPYKNKRDINEPEIFDILRAHGFQIHPMDTPCDALCAYDGVNYLVEVKNGVKAPFTTAQKLFRKDWPGQYKVLATNQQAINWCREIRNVRIGEA